MWVFTVFKSPFLLMLPFLRLTLLGNPERVLLVGDLSPYSGRWGILSLTVLNIGGPLHLPTSLVPVWEMGLIAFSSCSLAWPPHWSRTPSCFCWFSLWGYLI